MVLNQGVERLIAQLTAEIRERVPAEQQEAVLEFVAQGYTGYSSQDFMGRELSDLYGSTMGSWAYLQKRDPDTPKIRIFNPEYQKHGWQLGHTVIVILTRDMPFITDSVRGELNRRNITIHTIHSNVFSIIRDSDFQLEKLLPSRSVVKPGPESHLCEEALLYLEIGRSTDQAEIADIIATLTEVLMEVAVVVDDFKNMTDKGQDAISEIANLPASLSSSNTNNLEEVKAFIQWMCDGHFTFLGYEELAVSHTDGAPLVTRVDNTALGLLKRRISLGQADLNNTINSLHDQQDLLEEILIFAKSSIRSRVHRLIYPDYILIRRFDEQGRLIGQHRFLGMYTSKVYTLSPSLIPVLRNKIKVVLDRSELDFETHEGKDLIRVLEVFPRDELFQSTVDELFSTAMAVNQIQERRQVRLFVRYDHFDKFVSCLVYTPRDVYRTEIRIKLENLLCDVFGAESSEFTTYFSESILIRTHFVLRLGPERQHDVDIHALEQEVVRVTMSWTDHLTKYLLDEFGEEQGSELIENYSSAFSPGYMHDFEARAAIDDINKIATLGSADDIAMSFYRNLGENDKIVCFRLFHLDSPLPLSDVIPILERLGLRVENEHPYQISRRDGRNIFIHEFSMIYGLNLSINFNKVGQIFQESFLRIWQGDAESDSFNKLIIGAQIGWRQIAMLRAYSRYMKQIQFNFSGDYIADTLSNHQDITRKIVELFNTRFDPQFANSKEREQRESILDQEIIKALDDVENLGEDHIIRQYLALIKATLRTNYFQHEPGGELKSYFSFKLSPAQIPDVPAPVPMYEIFVYSPRVEGVHLRGGKVARGGLRWSDRLEDFRTEVLGLVKAQQVKNAVIVPTGAKGGFVAKQSPVEGGREALQKEGISCYKIFIQGLLDVTDNLLEGVVVPPAEVVCNDDDDTYLVVAADKGTATFSDIANELSLKYGFWLGDAFASGGSEGYDHKKMGITAKGAWVSVQRHFREMGINIQEVDFTVVGIGDMAGDVFGNGMLLSEHIQLVCAFNHMHIFIDPNPDSSSSYEERMRLFKLPRSSWTDYNQQLISNGGGIFKRSAKSVDISDEMKARFDITADKLTPNQLISAVLKAPVDLLWNGGIGTYVKSSTESHAEVGDKANDALRVNADELRCKVIGEGGNLGVTQLSRVEYCLHGGRSNTDFIDNAAGVDCSDHEVNIKILLNELVSSDDMTEKQRNTLLQAMTNSVAELVLVNNYRQTQAISIAERDAVLRAGEYNRLINSMVSTGRLDRQLEFIPEDDVIQERLACNKSLTRPELSVLISYVKSQLKEELVDTSISDDSYIINIVETAFPERLREKFKPLIHDHRLRREIIATQLANDMVNHMGISFVDRMAQSTGVTSCEIARAYVTAREVFNMFEIWQQIEKLDYHVAADVQMELMAEIMRLVRRASRWFIRNRRGQIETVREIADFKDSIARLVEILPDIIHGDMEKARNETCQNYIDKGVPEELANRIASVRELFPFLGIIDAAKEMDVPVEKVAEVFFSISERLELDWFSQQVSALKVDNYWQAMARESYRDDLDWQLRALTMGAMRHICSKGDVEACIDRWMEQQSLLVDRWRAMLSQLQAAATQEFAMYSVAIRELLDMAQSSKYGEV